MEEVIQIEGSPSPDHLNFEKARDRIAPKDLHGSLQTHRAELDLPVALELREP